MRKLFSIPLTLLIFSLFVVSAHAATFDLVVEKDTYKIGDTFSVHMHVNGEGEGINGAQATVKFDSTLIELTSTDKTDSIFDFWVADPVVSSGQVSFIGASTVGYDGKSLQVLKLNFKVKGAGTANLVFSDAAITAADGNGSNVLSQSNNLTINLVSSVGNTKPTQINRTPVLSDGSPEQPNIVVNLYSDPSKWNNISAAFFASWKLPKDVSDVSMVLDKFGNTTPTQSEGLFDTKKFPALEDGIYYIHARYKNNIGWGKMEHYKIAIDTNPPSKFSIVFPNGESTDNPKPSITYKSSDSLSGIARYEIIIDNTAPISVATSSYTLPLQNPGKHTLKVIAYDNAGNTTQSVSNFETLSIEMPTITLVNKNVFIGEGGFFISGTANPKYKVRIVLKDQVENVVYDNVKTLDEKGNWNANVDTPLKKQTYHFEVSALDERGAVSNPSKSEAITVRERPIFIIGGLEVTLAWLFILFVLVAIVAFGLGWASIKFAEDARGVDSVIAGRDIDNLFTSFERDIATVLAKYTDKGLDTTATMETKALLEHLSDKIEKMKKYMKPDTDINDQRSFLISLFKRLKEALHVW